MKKINETFHSTPAEYDKKFNGSLGVWDMDRLEKLAKYFIGGKYLDVGCFDSIMPILLAERHPQSDIYALDHAPGLINFMRKRFLKVLWLCDDAYRLPFEDNNLDYIVAGEFIEHLERPEDFVKEAMRVLKPGGWLAISTPFEEAGNSVGGKYHMWHWTVDDIKKLLDTEDVEVLQETSSKSILAWKQKK